MRYNNVIKFKVTKEQLERVKNMAEEEGYSTLSDSEKRKGKNTRRE